MSFPHGHYEVFIDESGDLGFNGKGSKTIVIAYVVTNNPHEMRNAVRRVRKSLNQKRRSSLPEFKFNHDSDEVRDRVLKGIAKCTFDLGLVAVDKRSVKQSLKEDPARLYRFIVIKYVITSLVSAYDITHLRFVIDRRLSGESKAAFNAYLMDKLSWRQVVEKGEPMPAVEVVHASSDSDECLQVADYCSGATYARVEHGDPTYFGLILPRVIFRTPWGMIDW